MTLADLKSLSIKSFYSGVVEGFRRNEDGSVISDRVLGTDPERYILKVFTQFCLRHDADIVRHLFAEFGPRRKREAAADRREFMAFLYGLNGRPPKERFAREVARLNKKLPYEKRIGPRTTDPGNMLQYINRMFREKKYREIADLGVEGFPTANARPDKKT
jgi:hypothetical protein